MAEAGAELLLGLGWNSSFGGGVGLLLWRVQGRLGGGVPHPAPEPVPTPQPPAPHCSSTSYSPSPQLPLPPLPSALVPPALAWPGWELPPLLLRSGWTRTGAVTTAECLRAKPELQQKVRRGRKSGHGVCGGIVTKDLKQGSGTGVIRGKKV